MRKLISPEEMLRCERAYFENSGVRSIDVMERAAQALSDAVIRHFPDARRICIACGPGGNGGDGYACARLLHAAGREVRIYEACLPKSPDAVENRQRAMELEIEINPTQATLPDVWVDCLYGTGLSRAPEGRAAELIRRMNMSPAKILSADIPSGLCGRTGRAYEPCVQADVTVTFQYAKTGHLLCDGPDMCGRLELADVGFPPEAFPQKLPLQFEPGDITPLLRPRKRNTHKGKFGHLLIIAGSVGMAGAAVLCVKAALRCGVGLVTVACPGEIVPIIQLSAPCAMCIPLPQEDGHISHGALETVRSALAGKTAVAIGPGLTKKVSPEILSAVLDSGLPAVIDADALNIIAENPALKARLQPQHVITPHPGEAARLLGRKCGDPIADCRELAETGACVVLKGASRVICDRENTFISASGSCCMARGGSGDILTGITGALLAGEAVFGAEPAAAACEIHGLCGEMVEDKYGVRGGKSADLIEMLPEVLKEYAQ